MPKLWIFGDSFSTKAPNNLEYPTWTEVVTTRLNVTCCENFSMNGVSNDYIFYKLAEQFKKMSQDDYVIVQTSQKNRQWFFNDPSLSNYTMGDLAKYITSDQSLALDYFLTQLQNDELDEIRYVQFSLALERMTDVLRHTRMLILPGFVPVHGVTGSLLEVSQGEFKDLSTVKSFYKKDGKVGIDPRHNHLLPENHVTLANKIVEYFTTGNMIDLSCDFKNNII